MLLLLLCRLVAAGDLNVFKHDIWPVLSGTGEVGTFTCGSCCGNEEAFGHVQCAQGFIRKLSFISEVPPLNGTIPTTIASLTKLETLMLQYNELHGVLPPLPSTLEGLFVHENKLSGALPATLPATLTQLQAYANRLSGAVVIKPSLPLLSTAGGCWIMDANNAREENCFTCPLSSPLHPSCVCNVSYSPEKEICGLVWAATCVPYTSSPTTSPTSAPSPAPTPPTLSPTAAPVASLSPLASSSPSSSLASALLIVASAAAVCMVSLLIAALVFLVVRRRRRRRSPRRVDSGITNTSHGTSDFAGRASTLMTLESLQYAAVPRRGRSYGSSRRQSRKLAPAPSSTRARHSLASTAADYGVISHQAASSSDGSTVVKGYGALPDEGVQTSGGSAAAALVGYGALPDEDNGGNGGSSVEHSYGTAPSVSGSDSNYENMPALQ